MDHEQVLQHIRRLPEEHRRYRAHFPSDEESHYLGTLDELREIERAVLEARRTLIHSRAVQGVAS